MKNKKVRITHRSVSFERRWVKTKEFKNTIKTLWIASMICIILPALVLFLPSVFTVAVIKEAVILEAMAFVTWLAVVAIDVRTITMEELEGLEYEIIS